MSRCQKSVVTTAYGQMATANPVFARFTRIRVDGHGNVDPEDLRQGWAGGAVLIALTPR